MKKMQGGFTLIELVVVIVILGILAATALPRFYDMATQARIAKLNAGLGAVKSAAAIAHAAWLAAGGSGNSPTTVSMEGKTINLLNGYPDSIEVLATTYGIISAAGGLTDYNLPALPIATATAITVNPDAAHTGATCGFSYTPSTGVNIAPVISAPVTSSC